MTYTRRVFSCLGPLAVLTKLGASCKRSNEELAIIHFHGCRSFSGLKPKVLRAFSWFLSQRTAAYDASVQESLVSCGSFNKNMRNGCSTFRLCALVGNLLFVNLDVLVNDIFFLSFKLLNVYQRCWGL